MRYYVLRPTVMLQLQGKATKLSRDSRWGKASSPQGRGADRWGKVVPLEVETPGKWANI